MSYEIAAAAFIRAAACSSAAEARKATLRFPSHIGIKYPPSRGHHFPSFRSAPPAGAAQRRRSFTESTYGVYSNRSTSMRAQAGKGVPNLGRLAKTSLLILILQKTGNLVSPPPPKADKNKAALNLALLSVGLLIGYVASKDGSKLATVLKTCDGTMKFYKVVTEIADILSTFFK